MKRLAGFTLVELVVSIGIVVLISSMILFNAPKFNRTMALNRAAREVASTLRLAQARATQVRATASGEFPDNYGIHFDLTKPDEFVLFNDNTTCPDKNYTQLCSVTEEVIKYHLGNGVYIEKLEWPITPGCPPNLPLPSPLVTPSLNILFYRPDPAITATCVLADGVTVNNLNGYGPFKIYVKSPDESIPEKEVHVWLTGQISVK